jgi:arginine/lysine/ornithine decarboxylase
LVRIKRLLLAGRYPFSLKAEIEMFSDDLTADDVVEAVVNAPAISKKLRSRSSRRLAPDEKLFVIVGSTYDGVLVYTKGTVRRVHGEDVYYFFVSSKRSTVEDDASS